MTDKFGIFNNSKIEEYNKIILTDFFGYLSGTLGAIRLIPQVIKVFKTKSTNDLSYIYLFLAFFTCASRTIYGLFIGSVPIIVTSPIISTNVLIIIIAKSIYDKKNIVKKDEEKEDASV